MNALPLTFYIDWFRPRPRYASSQASVNAGATTKGIEMRSSDSAALEEARFLSERRPQSPSCGREAGSGEAVESASDGRRSRASALKASRSPALLVPPTAIGRCADFCRVRSKNLIGPQCFAMLTLVRHF